VLACLAPSSQTAAAAAAAATTTITTNSLEILQKQHHLQRYLEQQHLKQQCQLDNSICHNMQKIHNII
jgi:hypothetical protein